MYKTTIRGKREETMHWMLGWENIHLGWLSLHVYVYTCRSYLSIRLSFRIKFATVPSGVCEILHTSLIAFKELSWHNMTWLIVRLLLGNFLSSLWLSYAKLHRKVELLSHRCLGRAFITLAFLPSNVRLHEHSSWDNSWENF